MQDYKITVSNEYVVNKYKTVDKVAGDVLAKLIYEIKVNGLYDPNTAEVITTLEQCYLTLLKKESTNG